MWISLWQNAEGHIKVEKSQHNTTINHTIECVLLMNDLEMSRIESRSNNFEMKGFCSLTLLMMFCSVS